MAADPPPTQPDEGAPPPTSLDDGNEAPGAPPTSLDDGAGSPAGSSDTYIQLPPPLREEYETLRDIASGGEGDLLLIRHRPSGELRVAKVYRGERRRDERAVELLRDADREHVVEIHESGRHGGRSWEVMEYCEYGSLVDLVAAEGPRLPLPRVEETIAEVAAALEHVHELRIPHRDLKPANIMVRSARPRLDLVLADFGLARLLDLSKEMHSRLIISAAYASPQSSSSGAISPAMDWWSLGIIAAELAQGRNPFQLENGEWLDNRAIMDWVSSRSIDLSGIEDERLRNLCRGLTLRDDRRGHRWGAEEVRAWLDGEDPEVAAEADASSATRVAASPVPFPDPDTGRPRPFTDPVELAAALARRWDEACELLGGSAARRADQRALRNFLRSLGLERAEQVLAEQDDVEERLVRLLVELDPAIVPTFRGYAIDRHGLATLATADGEGARDALSAVFSERVLLDYSRSSGFGDLADLDAAWHEEMAAFEATIESARSEDGKPILGDSRERAAAVEAARGQVLVALIDPDARRRVLKRAGEAAADQHARSEAWFAEVADRVGDD